MSCFTAIYQFIFQSFTFRIFSESTQKSYKSLEVLVTIKNKNNILSDKQEQVSGQLPPRKIASGQGQGLGQFQGWGQFSLGEIVLEPWEYYVGNSISTNKGAKNLLDRSVPLLLFLFGQQTSCSLHFFLLCSYYDLINIYRVNKSVADLYITCQQPFADVFQTR